MKKLIAILVLVASQVLGQTNDTVYLAKIQKFILDNEGKKVGTGLCFDLVDKALMQIDPTWKQRSMGKKSYIFGKKMNIKKGVEVRVGDVFVLEERVQDGKALPSHVGIIVYVDENNMPIIAHQNVGVKNKKDSKVVFWTLDEFTKGVSNKKVKMFRPFLPKN